MQITEPKTEEQWAEYFQLRWRVLRAPWDQPLGSERDELEESADHVMALDEEQRVVGVGRLHLNNDAEAQVRYMAIAEGCRGNGCGQAILARLEELARGHGVERVVLNARDTAAGFYTRLGYTAIGPGQTLFGAISHSQMEKRL